MMIAHESAVDDNWIRIRKEYINSNIHERARRDNAV